MNERIVQISVSRNAPNRHSGSHSETPWTMQITFLSNPTDAFVNTICGLENCMQHTGKERRTEIRWKLLLPEREKKKSRPRFIFIHLLWFGIYYHREHGSSNEFEHEMNSPIERGGLRRSYDKSTFVFDLTRVKCTRTYGLFGGGEARCVESNLRKERMNGV